MLHFIHLPRSLREWIFTKQCKEKRLADLINADIFFLAIDSVFSILHGFALTRCCDVWSVGNPLVVFFQFPVSVPVKLKHHYADVRYVAWRPELTPSRLAPSDRPTHGRTDGRTDGGE